MFFTIIIVEQRDIDLQNVTYCNASINSSGTHLPSPPRQPRAFAHVVSPGGGAFTILSQPGGWAFDTHVFER